ADRSAASGSRADPREDAGRAALSRAGDANRDRGRWILRRRSRSAPARHGGLAAQRQARAPPRAAARGIREERDFARVRRSAVPTDPRLRRLRLPRVARRVVRALGVRLGLAKDALSGALRVCAPELTADGLL